MNESQLKKPLATLEGFCGIVTCLAFSPDARWLVSGATNGLVTLWDIASRSAIKTFEGYSKSIVTVAFSFDGKMLLSGAEDGVLIAWDVDSGNQVWTDVEFAGKPCSALFVPFTEHLLWLTQHNSLKICDPRLNYTEPVQSIAFSPDGLMIVSGSHTVRLWEVGTGRLLRTLSGHSSYVWSVAFSPDGQTVASGSADNTVKLWEVVTRKLIRTLSGHSNSVNSIAFSPDGQMIASGSRDHTVKLWEVGTGRLLRTLSGHSDSVNSIAFSLDSQTIVSGSDDSSLKHWRIDSGEMSPITGEVQEEIVDIASGLDDQDDEIIAIASGPDDQRVLAADKNGRLWFFELTPDGKKHLVCHTDYISGVNDVQVSQSLNGRFALLTREQSTAIRLLDLSTGQTARSFVGHKKPVVSAALSPDGGFMVSGGGDRAIHLWRVATGELVRILRAHTAGIGAVTFSPDGRYIASGGDDQTIKLWHGTEPGGAATLQQIVSPSRRVLPMTLPDSPPASLAVPGASQELLEAMRVQIDTHERRVAKLESLVEKLFRLMDSQGKASLEDAVIIQRKSFDDF